MWHLSLGFGAFVLVGELSDNDGDGQRHEDETEHECHAPHHHAQRGLRAEVPIPGTLGWNGEGREDWRIRVVDTGVFRI